ncbi:hypothetical protein [Actinocorallia longicatena]|uniref:LysR substrate binding domain-containing protein n=1 Tax=Actinocorallia longicatena TaxID=111803 RepID=A0ABP6QB86_9ACTN
MTVYDQIVDEVGAPWIVMEPVQEEDVSEATLSVAWPKTATSPATAAFIRSAAAAVDFSTATSQQRR